MATIQRLSPTYRTTAAGVPGILHLGVGNFFRSHLAYYTDAVLRAGGSSSSDWRIHGVGLLDHPAEASLHAQLHSQDLLYGLLSLPSGDARAIGCLQQLTHTPAGPDALGTVLGGMAATETRIVSMTVTEKGYHHDPITGDLDLSSPDSPVYRDLEALRASSEPQRLESAIGTLVAGMQRRHQAGGAPVTLLCCDNLPSNGAVLQRLVLQMAGELDPKLAAWLQTSDVAFPNSMVDRITPAPAADTGARFAAAAGIDEPCAAPVQAEDYHTWIVEDTFAAGRPAWEDAEPAVQFVEDVIPYEDMKLRLLNGSHTALAYVSSLLFQAEGKSAPSVDAAMADPDVTRFVRAFMDEVAPTLHGGPEGPEALEEYKASLRTRFSNPDISDAVSRLAQDGSKKFLGFIKPGLEERLESGIAPTAATAGVVASWCAYLASWKDIDDPAGRDELVPLARRVPNAGGLEAFIDASLGPVVAGHPGFVGEVAHALACLESKGVREMMGLASK